MELEKSIKKQNNDIAIRLGKQVIDTVANGCNLIFSPTSINVLLSLIAAGSNSVTKEQILSFIMSPSTDHLNTVLAQIVDGTEKSDVCLSMGNGVWINKSFSLKHSYKDLLENSYKATCSQVDFANMPIEVIDDLNRWAEVHTNGLIKTIISREIDSIEIIRNSDLILANAVYFKGAWKRKFDANLTKDNKFHLLNGNTVKVPFMSNDKDQYLRDCDGFQVLRLPYVEDQRQFSMYIYLPNKKDGIANLLEKISSEPGFFDNHIPLHRISISAFRIPKFKFTTEFKASEVLKDMGLTSPFTSEGSLTEMVESGDNLFVSSIIHKACIEVDEEGTEAAAVTVGIMRVTCFIQKPDFVADHPFLFTVREDKSGVILFMGQVLDPSKH